MTVQECYAAMGGNYEEVVSRLRTEERIKKFLLKVADDPSYQLLCDSMESGNLEEAFRAAHTLKGISSNLSLSRLQESASVLTDILREQREQKSDEMNKALERVQEDYALTIKGIKEMAGEM